MAKPPILFPVKDPQQELQQDRLNGSEQYV